MNAVRRVLRWALESGAAHPVRQPREFIVAFPFGGAPSSKNPRPFSDPVLATLSDPANIALLDGSDPHDGGLEDIWSIQLRCGRRIGEVVKLRFDCVSEHLGRTWMWVDMTKVGKLDYAIQIPRDIYDLIRTRQGKTLQRFRAKFGADPTPKQRRSRSFPQSGVVKCGGDLQAGAGGGARDEVDDDFVAGQGTLGMRDNGVDPSAHREPWFSRPFSLGRFRARPPSRWRARVWIVTHVQQRQPVC